MSFPPHIPNIFLINSLIVSLVVVIHYEFLFLMTRLIPRLSLAPRYRIAVGVFGSLIAHAIEVWIFALAFYFMHHADGWGTLTGNCNGTVFDCVYYSFATFSTLGYGDIVPQGALRYLTGIEALTGLVLIAWSASFLYMEMEQLWMRGKRSVRNDETEN